MTTTSWQKLFGFGACIGLLAAACTVSSGDGNDDEPTTGVGGTGGDGGSGGTVSDGGSGGTSPTSTTNSVTNTATVTSTATSTTGGGGSGGSPEEVECLDDASGEITGEVATCEPDNDNCCARCMATHCCEEYSECFAFDPFNICGGSSDEDSEITVFINCMLEIGVDEGGAIPGTDEGSDFENCIFQATNDVSGPYCGLSTISGPTNNLAVCLHGDEDGLDGCFNECLNADFEEDECLY